MLEIRLLGELQVLRDGVAVPLPASRKSRALLAYLAATQRAHLRERLCELLWEGPDDPRAALRWSLTKLRPLLGDHLVSGRAHVAFRADGAMLDLLQLCVPETATTDSLERCAAMFRGDFLEGLDLPACFRYQQWCVGERERIRQAHIAILAELTRRHTGSDAALQHARRRVAIDPFNDQAHATLIRLLASSGEQHEALRHYEHCRELFERELGTRPGTLVEEARRTVGGAPRASRVEPVRETRGAAPFVGRAREMEEILAAPGPTLVLGEPGIGKSRLLEELRARVGGTTLYGRAFAAEMIRPYGVWIEALGEFPMENDRTGLFDVISGRLSGVTLLEIDDLQWIDEASSALLHYIARTSKVRLVCGARLGEIDDNAHAKRLLRELRFHTIELGPLTEREMRTLVHDDRVVRLSGGNPLFALELSRSGTGVGTAPVTSVIAQRLDELAGPARELVSWAAAIGHEFDAETVGRATAMSAGQMLGALEKLERLAIIRAAGHQTWDFVHDLVRDAAYQMITGPRRTLVHRHIARALRESHDPEGALAGDIVHHASLAGDHELACEAAVLAGKRCLRLFAYAEAVNVARRGLQIAESLTGNARLEMEMRLFSVIVMARLPARERHPFAPRIAETMERARRAGLAGTAGLGAHLLAWMYEETNNYGDAADAIIQSAELSRFADPATAVLSLATSARCLLQLGRDIPRAEELLAQAQAIGSDNHELPLALGYLSAHRGNTEDAVLHLERALAAASRQQDHWREWVALSRLTTLALEDGNPRLALRQCARLHPVAAQMHGGSEAVRSAVLESVARHAAGENVDIAEAIEQLRGIDSKSDLAWTLSYLATIDPDRERARRYATEALAAAESAGRASEMLIARSILGLPARATRDVSARARRFLKERKHGRTGARAIV